MTSQGPYLAELNVTHYDNECTKKPVIIPKTKENNLLGFLQNNKEYSIFAYLDDLAKLSGLFNSDQVYITLFAVTNKEIKKHYPEEVFLNLDLLSARKIILNHTLERNISLNMLKSSRSLYLHNKADTRLLYERDSEGNMKINRVIKLKNEMEKVDNAIVLFVDNIIMPHDLTCNLQPFPVC